jgi:hypothetical protein
MAIEKYKGLGRLPRLGKIHLGIKVQSKTNPDVWYPQATEYFVCPPELQALAGIGPRPQELRVMFLQNEIDKAASLFYRAYGSGTGSVCRGDGEIANAVVDVAAWARAGQQVQAGIWATSKSAKTERVEIPCTGEGGYGVPACPHYEAKKCRRVLMLQVVVLGAPRLGVYQIDTGSYYGTLNILGWLEMIQGVFGGRIAGLPMILRLVPQEVTADGKKKIVRVLQLTAEGDAERFLELAMMPIREAIATRTRLALPEGREAGVLEGEAVEPDEGGAGVFCGDPSELPAEEELAGDIPAGNTPAREPTPPAQAGLDLPPPEFPAAPPEDSDGEDGLAAEADAAVKNGGARAARGTGGVTPSAPVAPRGAPTSTRPAPSAGGRPVAMACPHVSQAEKNRRWAIERGKGARGNASMCVCCEGPAPVGEANCEQCPAPSPA